MNVAQELWLINYTDALAEAPHQTMRGNRLRHGATCQINGHIRLYMTAQRYIIIRACDDGTGIVKPGGR